MPEENSYCDPLYYEETINGQKVHKLCCPSTIHNMVRSSINLLIDKHIVQNADSKREVLRGIPVRLSENDYFVPDAMVIPDCEQIEDDIVISTPELVVEVLSPDTADKDRKYKKSAYAKAGVKEYWLVSPEAESVEQYLLQNGQFVLQGVYTVYPEYILDKLTAEERAAIPSGFNCHLFADCVIKLQDIFQQMENIREIINKNHYK